MTVRTARIRIEDLEPLENLTEAEMAEIYGAGRKGKWKFSGQAMEVLEVRQVMSAVTVALAPETQSTINNAVHTATGVDPSVPEQMVPAVLQALQQVRQQAASLQNGSGQITFNSDAARQQFIAALDGILGSQLNNASSGSLQAAGITVISRASASEIDAFLTEGTAASQDLLVLRLQRISTETLTVTATETDQIALQGKSISATVTGTLTGTLEVAGDLVFGLDATGRAFVREGSSVSATTDVTGNLSSVANPNSQVGVALTGAGHFTGGSQYAVNDGDTIDAENLYLDMDALFSDFETNTTVTGDMDFDGVTAALTIPGLANPVNVPATFEWNPLENTGNITIDEDAVEDSILDAVAESVDHALEQLSDRTRASITSEFDVEVQEQIKPLNLVPPNDGGPVNSEQTRNQLASVTADKLSIALQKAIESAKTGIEEKVRQDVNQLLTNSTEFAAIQQSVEFSHNWGNEIDTIFGMKNHGDWERLRVWTPQLTGLTVTMPDASRGGNLLRVDGRLSIEVSWDKEIWNHGVNFGSYSENGHVEVFFRFDLVTGFQVEHSSTDALDVQVTVASASFEAIPVLRDFSPAMQTLGVFGTLLTGSSVGRLVQADVVSPFVNQLKRIDARASIQFNEHSGEYNANVSVTFGGSPILQQTVTLPGILATDANAGPININRGGYQGPSVLYVNGAQTTQATAEQEAEMLSHQLKRPVKLLYNGTSGLSDLAEVLSDYTWKQMQSQHNTTTELLAAFLKRAAQTGEMFSVVTHSQGNMIMWNALQSVRGEGLGAALEHNLYWVSTGSPLAVSGVKGHTNLLNANDPIGVLTGNFSDFSVESHQFVNYVGQISRDIVAPNRAPTAITLNVYSIHENALGGVVGQLHAVDPDGIDTHSYELVDKEGLFEIDSADGKSLKLKKDRYLNYELTPTVNVQVKAIDDSGASYVQTLTIYVANVDESIRTELVNNVLIVQGTDQDDNIRVESFGVGKRAVFNKDELVGTYDATAVQRIEVLGLAGNDTISLTEISIDAWVYGGAGDDTIKGGSGDDHLFGMGGADDLQGNAGNDLIYGGEGRKDENGQIVAYNQIDGGSGADFLSLSPGKTFADIASGDTDVESLSFEDRAYFDLIHKHRDSQGFVVVLKDGAPDQQGDAVIFTGLAAATAAMRGDDATVRELLLTLRDKPFIEEGGKTRLIRHPLIWDYVKDKNGEYRDSDGNTYSRDRHSPVTKDGVNGVMTGLYYAYTESGMSEETRALAKEVMGKYIDFLIDNQWKTLDHYPDHYWDRHPDDGKKFANVFSLNHGSNTVNTTMAKGFEGYMLAPNDRYAMQNVAAKMGFNTSHWQIWGGFAASVSQSIGDGYDQIIESVADGIANLVRKDLDKLLTAIQFETEYSFHVIPGIDQTLVEGDLELSISSERRASIVNGISSATREVIVQFLGNQSLDTLADGATEVPAFILQLNDMAGRLVDQIFDALPSWAEADTWKPLITSTLQQVMPWLNGDTISEIVAFRFSHELAKTDEIVAHLSFWPTLLEFETRPEMIDLLGWSVNDLDAYLSTDHQYHQQNLTDMQDFFVKDLYRMDMGLYNWLNGDFNKTDWWLFKFENDPRFSNLEFTWKKSHSENLKMVLKAGDRPTVMDEAAFQDRGHHRLDYLLLKSLRDNGRPKPLSHKVDWLQHWRDVINDTGDQLLKLAEQGWNDLRKDVVKFAIALKNELNLGYSQIAQALWSLNNDLSQVATGLWSIEKDFSQLAGSVWSFASNDISKYADVIWNYASNDVGKYAQALWDNATHDLGKIADEVWNHAGNNLSRLAQALKDTAAGPDEIVNQVWIKCRDHHKGDLNKFAGALKAANAPIGDIATQVWARAGGDLNKVASALKAAKASTGEIATELWKRASNDLNRFAAGLKEANATTSEIATEVWARASGDLNKLASALKAAKASTGEIATELWKRASNDLNRFAAGLKAINTSTSDIANEVWSRAGGNLNRLASALKAANASPAEIAAEIWKRSGNDLNKLAGALNAITAGVGEIATQVWNRADGDLNKLAGALVSVGDSSRGVAQALGRVSRDVSKIAQALKDHVSSNLNTIAEAMWSINWTTVQNIAGGLGAVTRNASAIAGAISAKVTGNLSSIADAMYRGIGWTSYRDVAAGLGSLTRNAASIAGAISGALGASYSTIADAMYRGISWTSYRDVAAGLGSLTRSASSIAGALRNTLGASYGTIADAMWHGISWTSHRDVAAGLGSVTRDASAIAGALRNSIGASYRTIADAMYRGISWTSYTDVGRGLRAVTNDANVIASALRNGAGAADSTIRSVLRSVGNGAANLNNAINSVSNAVNSAANTVNNVISSIARRPW